MAHYIKNSDLYDHLDAWHKAENKKASLDILVNDFYLIASNMLKKYKSRAAFEIDEDNLQNCVITCMLKLSRYDMNRRPITCFNFFTTCIMNEIRQNHRSAKVYESHVNDYMAENIISNQNSLGMTYQRFERFERKKPNITGFSQRRLAKEIGVSLATLKRWIKKGSMPAPTRLKKKYKYYGDEEAPKLIELGKQLNKSLNDV